MPRRMKRRQVPGLTETMTCYTFVEAARSPPGGRPTRCRVAKSPSKAAETAVFMHIYLLLDLRPNLAHAHASVLDTISIVV